MFELGKPNVTTEKKLIAYHFSLMLLFLTIFALYGHIFKKIDLSLVEENYDTQAFVIFLVEYYILL